MMTGWLTFWLVAIILLALIEIATTQLVAIWMAAGALGALVACSLGAPLLTQFLIFIALSIALLIPTRPLVRRFIRVRQEKTNADRLIGVEAEVTERISNSDSTGAVRISGITWTARTTDGAVAEAGDRVKVERIEGVKLIVTKL